MIERTHRPVDERRREVFLQVLRDTGSVSAACAAATPHSDGGRETRPGYRSFLDLMKRDPDFAAEVEEAKNHALGMVERTIADRAFNPEQLPIFHRGELVGYREDRRDANVLLLRLAERLSDEWSPKKHVKGEVEHRHAHAVFMLEIGHLELLTADERERFLSLLSLIEERSGEPERLPAGRPDDRSHLLPGHVVAGADVDRRPDPNNDHRAGAHDGRGVEQDVS